MAGWAAPATRACGGARPTLSALRICGILMPAPLGKPCQDEGRPRRGPVQLAGR